MFLGDIYSRWNSFTHAEDWKTKVLSGRVVERMECGAIYEMQPKEKKLDPVLRTQKVPIRFREITIDIDMDDYDM